MRNKFKVHFNICTSMVKVCFKQNGKNKSFKQISAIENAFVVTDTDYTTEENRIPLWLFGLMK